MRQELGKYWDFAIWVDAPYEIRLRRGVDRDGEQMRSQWTDIWMPEEAEYVKGHTDRKTEPTSSLMARSPSAFEIRVRDRRGHEPAVAERMSPTGTRRRASRRDRTAVSFARHRRK